MSEPLIELDYLEVDAGGVAAVRRPVIAESVWRLRVNGQPWSTLVCTPLDIHHLALGHALATGALAGLEELAALDVQAAAGQSWRYVPGAGLSQPDPGDEPASGGLIDLWLRRDGPVAPPAEQLPVSARSCPSVSGDLRIAPAQLLELMREMSYQAPLYRQARGLHTAALSDGARLLVQVEDISCYNAADKLRGLCAAQGLASSHLALLTTGRISSLMLLKARRMDIPLVASRTSPTAAAVRLARHWNMTLVGYARAPGLRVYAGAWRLGLEPAP
ncbi:MAG TPA: formate dehydrogenase accessory sulfurtransferase FdhD [Herpetosiphonaceae bacterium]